MSHSSYAAPEQSESGEGPVRLFFEGDPLYEDMLAAIDNARERILLEAYIFADDTIGRRFADALGRAAGRGVAVRIHVDAAGSLFEAGPGFFQAMARRGVTVRRFHKWSWQDPWRYNRRNHGKLLIIDDNHFYVGGFNLHEAASRRAVGESRWRDTHARVDAPSVVQQAAAAFDALWEQRRKLAHAIAPESAPVQLITNRIRGHRSGIRASLRSAIAHARHELRVTTPYFSPDALTLRHLTRAAGRGVRVELLLPAISDHQMPVFAARHIYRRLMKTGVIIHEYQPRVLHAKTMTVDGRWASIGTANLDYRSFFDNYETNLVVASETVCGELDRQFRQDLTESKTIHPEELHGNILQPVIGPLAWRLRRWM